MEGNREVMIAWMGLHQANTAVHEAIGARIAEEIGCSLPEYNLMNYLAAAGGGKLRMTELAELLCVSPSAITRMVDRLIDRDWVGRWQPPENRRVAYAQLTSAGRAKLAEARHVFKSALSDSFVSHLSDQDIADLRRVNEKLLTGLGRWDERRCCPPDQAAAVSPSCGAAPESE